MSRTAPAEPAAPGGSATGITPDATAVAAAPARITPSPTAGTILCENCGARLTGKYCSECGQRHHDHPVHDFWHFVSEALEDLTHADSRVWQTLTALLFRPGFLTQEFLAGRRVRFLPPLRVYLVVSVIFFIIVGLGSRNANSYVVLTYNGKRFNYEVVPAGKATAPAAAARAPVSSATGNLASIAPTPAEPQRACERTEAVFVQQVPWLARFGPRVMQSCQDALAAGGVQRFNEDIEHNLERAMFLFLPLLALAMKPLYFRPPRHYIEHLLFFLHNHAFLFVVLGLSTLVGMATASPVVLTPLNAAIAIYIPIYFYRAMRRVYGQGRWLTLSKLTALGVVYFFLGAVLIALTASYSFLMF